MKDLRPPRARHPPAQSRTRAMFDGVETGRPSPSHGSLGTLRSRRHRLAGRVLYFLVPSFLRPSASSSSSAAAAPEHPSETAYLDGLRGLACFAVFLHHYILSFCHEPWHMYGEGANAHQVQTNHLFQLPIVRVVYSGQAAVAIFFVLSGYVLSYRPLTLMHARDHEKLQKSLASAVFRRWWRLFLPCLALFVLNFFLVELGVFDWFDEYRTTHLHLPGGTVESHLSHRENCIATAQEAWKIWWELVRNTLWNWTEGGYVPSLDPHLWTLHTEYRASNILILLLHCGSAMRHNVRAGFFLAVAAACHVGGQFALATFAVGSVIADFDLRRRQRPARDASSAPNDASLLSAPHRRGDRGGGLFHRLPRDYPQLIYVLLLTVSLVLLSYPLFAEGTISFYRLLYAITPTGVWNIMYWCSLGAMMMVYVAGRLHFFRRFLETPVAQYLGKISFALYLVHGTVIKSLGYFVTIKTGVYITGWKGTGFAVGILGSFGLVVMPVTVAAADVFWRAVDVPSVRFTRWMESLVVEGT